MKRILWELRHMAYHVLIGFVWARLLSGSVWVSIAGSLAPDLDHLYYFISYGKNDDYAKQVRFFFKKKDWLGLVSYMASGHKSLTALSTHNIFVTFIFMLLVFIFWNTKELAVFFGAVTLHYLFDMIDDLLQLGRMNPNWKRWGRSR